MKKKYELIETDICGVFRIMALRDFGYTKIGQFGGLVDSEMNLSQEGDCWIHKNAKVSDNARVSGDAQVYGTAQVSDYAHVSDKANVYGNAVVCGKANVFDNSRVRGNAQVYGEARVSGYAQVFANAQVFDKAQVYGEARVSGDAKVCGHAKVFDFAAAYGNAELQGHAQVFEYAEVYGYSFLCENVKVHGNAFVNNALLSQDAIVRTTEDYIVFKNWWSSGRFFCWTRSNNMWRAGCFYGTGEQLVRKAFSDSPRSGTEYRRIVNYVQDILGLPHI